MCFGVEILPSSFGLTTRYEKVLAVTRCLFRQAIVMPGLGEAAL